MKKLKIITWILLLLNCAVCFADDIKPGTKPKIIFREDWGARPALSDISQYKYDGKQSPTKIVLHNTALGAKSGKDAVKEIQNFHMDNDHWSDIGYNFLIDYSGTIYEGRYLYYVPSHAGQTKEANGTHDLTKDPDYNTIGIAFLGSSDQPWSAAQEQSAIQLINYFLTVYPKIEKIMTHAEVRQDILSSGLTPVGDFDSNICPGSATAKNIKTIKDCIIWSLRNKT